MFQTPNTDYEETRTHSVTKDSIQSDTANIVLQCYLSLQKLFESYNVLIIHFTTNSTVYSKCDSTYTLNNAGLKSVGYMRM